MRMWLLLLLMLLGAAGTCGLIAYGLTKVIFHFYDKNPPSDD